MCLSDAAHFQTGYQLRRLFIIILINCNPVEPHNLWNDYKDKFCDDLGHYLQTRQGIHNPGAEQIYDYGLYLIDKELRKFSGKGLEQFPSMPQPQENWAQHIGNRLIAAQRDYNREEMQLLAISEVAKMNPLQKHAFTSVITSVYENKGATFFLNGPAGTGKTYCYNAICHHL